MEAAATAPLPPARPPRPAPTATQQATSSLWGVGGERWTPTGRLADFSYAGYGAGELPIPAYPNRVNVRTYGARGDNTTGARGAAASAGASWQRAAA